MLTHARLLDLLKYNRRTGVFTWRVDRNGGAYTGSVAGWLNGGNGNYWRIKIDGVCYLAHQLVWFYVRGVFPEFQLDHKDGNTQNNRVGNLRPATKLQNAANRKLDSRNKSGATGVYFNKRQQRWVAQIQVNGKNRGCGNFDTQAEAAEARRLAAIRFFGKFAGELRA